MSGTAVLERIDEALHMQEEFEGRPTPDLSATLDEVDGIIDELAETEITILPTAVDERDVMIGALTAYALPLTASRIGMPLPVALGQRSTCV